MSETNQPTSRILPANWSLNQLPWWAITIVAIGLFLIFLFATDSNYYDTFMYLRVGVVTTMRMTLIAFPIATIIGLIVGLARTSKNTILFNAATFYVETVRGIPMIVIIIYIAFGLVPFAVEIVQSIGKWGLTWVGTGFLATFFQATSEYSIRNISMEMRAIFGLAMGYGAFEAEVFRAGIQSIGRGQMEAARSLGMTYFQAMRHVILPQAIRRVLPPLGNDFIALLKDSSLATVLAVEELTQMGRLRRSSTFRFMETFNVIAFLYLAMTLALSAFVNFLERRMKIEE